MNELIAKLKKLSIFKHKWVQFLMYLIKNFIDDNCSQKAALLTYTTLLSIVGGDSLHHPAVSRSA